MNEMNLNAFAELSTTEMETIDGGANWFCIGGGIACFVAVGVAIGATAISGGLLAPVAGSFAAACIGTTGVGIAGVTVGNIL